jgi:hypothetical protein
MDIAYKGDYYNCTIGVQLQKVGEVETLMGVDAILGFIASG